MYKNKVLAVAVFLIITTLGAILGANAVASRFGYHEVLGGALLELGGFKVYPPLRLFTWGSSSVLPQSSLKIGQIYAAIGLILAFASAFSIRLFGDKIGSRLTLNVFGDAAFAKLKDIREMGLIGKSRGIFLGKLKDGQYIRHDGPEHYAVIAPTRSGKGTGIVIPTLLTWRESCIVYDLKEENFQRTAGKRSEFSDVIYFNPNTLDTHRFNPLLEIRHGILEVRDAQNLANLIIEPDKPGVQDHWVRTGNSLLTAAILHVMYAGAPGEKNLAGVAGLLSRPDKSLTDTLLEMLETKHIRDESGKPLRPHPGVVAAARDVLNKSPDDKSSVVSTVMGYLGIYRDPLLANATRASDFAINDLVNGKRPMSLYMVIPPSDIDRLRPIIRIMVNMICRRLTEEAVRGEKRDQEHKHKLLLMLDEFPKLGRLEFFESALGFIAGYGLKTMLVAQSLQELRQVYGERSSLLDNTHVRVFYRPEEIHTAEYISKTLGQTTVEYKTKGESGKKGAPFFANASESMHMSSRPLLTPREVMELPADEALVLVGGGKPIRANKIKYHEDGSLMPLLKKAIKPKRGENRGIESVWYEERFNPPEDFEETEYQLANGHTVEMIVTGSVEAESSSKLEHPAAKASDSESDDTAEELA